ncbi:hypothetical protein DDB_G0285719 [Dictyostelium discoideum AX4]|nr:hypothetical protein DDB_G0285719 [Dictyostelium discoideum AX4]EAL64697.1 hypothetical protein DDB_G0285719 [Dictyostelium discoideum AX4]|eukprot:XP_638233.1 hypothetical protein DDB_G0285719 [Dictyostelium discoideum AX4]
MEEVEQQQQHQEAEFKVLLDNNDLAKLVFTFIIFMRQALLMSSEVIGN